MVLSFSFAHPKRHFERRHFETFYAHEMTNSIKTRAPPAWCIKVNTWTEPCINLAEMIADLPTTPT